MAFFWRTGGMDGCTRHAGMKWNLDLPATILASSRAESGHLAPFRRPLVSVLILLTCVADSAKLIYTFYERPLLPDATNTDYATNKEKRND